jgi:hypothetical protein
VKYGTIGNAQKFHRIIAVVLQKNGIVVNVKVIKKNKKMIYFN